MSGRPGYTSHGDQTSHADRRGRRGRLVARAVVLALGLLLCSAASASAHVGPGTPSATAYLARIDSVPVGVHAKVGEGDRLLWLRVDPRLTVLVLGLEGEPYLRFSPRGVEINEHSPTAYLNNYRVLAIPAAVNAHTPPRWRSLTDGHTYVWPEDRLHALDLAAHPAGAGAVGRWTIPLRVDGRQTAISGSLLYARAPSLAWLWPLIVVLSCTPALLRLRRRSANALVTSVLCYLALAGFVIGQLGFELHGRPQISVGQQIGFGISLALAATVLVLFACDRYRTVVAPVIAALGMFEGLTLRETLLQHFVLASLPAVVMRCAAITALACGVGALLVGVFGDPFGSERESDRGRAHGERIRGQPQREAAPTPPQPTELTR